ncbi:TonB-dependent receptor plug domain-containing protein [Vibrio kasasachensis]|uniref:TonB-dependent receptor plug domain-containing protein n=1 Tax=Vibrio kasasachensis TaxID=2910248 RepID=UPI003D13E606
MKPATALLLGLFSTSSVYSNDELPEQEVIVRDKIEAPLTSKETLTSEDIKKRPTGDGNITDLLKTNPAVQFSNSGNNGLSQGEIKPSDISIHGSTAYQNSFTLDGMSINNDIDPADNGLGVTNSNLSSDEQGFYLDSRLIESVTVYDANVPVEFGGFTGGVVETTSRSWQGATSANVYYRQTDSSWNKTHVDDKLEFNSSNNDVSNPARFQPDYVKRSYGVTFETGITDDLGFVASISRRTSSIPMAQVGGRSIVLEGDKLAGFEYDDSIKDQTRLSDNAFAKFTWYASARTTANLSIALSQYESELFMNGVANSDYTEEHNGLATTLQIEHMLDAGTLDVSLGHQAMEDIRTGEQNYFVQLEDFTDWQNPVTFASGGPGNLRTEQNNTSLKGKMSFNPERVGKTTHQFVVGGEATHTNAKYIREETYFRNGYRGMWDFMASANYANQVDAFFAGTYTTKYTNAALFAEDTIKVDDFTIRLGLRAERDDFVENNNFAPRFTASWDVLSNGNTVLTAGANRYYGRSMLTYALYEGQNAGLKHCYMMCDPNSEQQDSWTSTSDYEGMSDLKTPYNDELSLGLQQMWRNSIWSLNYVHRLGRDEVRSRPKYPGTSDPNEARIRTFDSGGETKHDSVSLTVRNRLPVMIENVRNQLSASLVWQQTQSNTPSDMGYAFFDPNTNLDYDKVWYDGKIINAADLPSTDFNSPLRANVEWIAELPQYGTTLYNLWQWQDGRAQATRHENDYAVDPSTGKQVLKYQRVDFEDTFRWDLKAEWKPSFAKGAAVSAEITNLLDNKNATDSFVHEAEVYRIYEAGRQFWLQASYDY